MLQRQIAQEKKIKKRLTECEGNKTKTGNRKLKLKTTPYILIFMYCEIFVPDN